jgi:hypothetical protein
LATRDRKQNPDKPAARKSAEERHNSIQPLSNLAVSANQIGHLRSSRVILWAQKMFGLDALIRNVFDGSWLVWRRQAFDAFFTCDTESTGAVVNQSALTLLEFLIVPYCDTHAKSYHRGMFGDKTSCGGLTWQL